MLQIIFFFFVYIFDNSFAWLLLNLSDQLFGL